MRSTSRAVSSMAGIFSIIYASFTVLSPHFSKISAAPPCRRMQAPTSRRKGNAVARFSRGHYLYFFSPTHTPSARHCHGSNPSSPARTLSVYLCLYPRPCRADGVCRCRSLFVRFRFCRFLRLARPAVAPANKAVFCFSPPRLRRSAGVHSPFSRLSLGCIKGLSPFTPVTV